MVLVQRLGNVRAFDGAKSAATRLLDNRRRLQLFDHRDWRNARRIAADQSTERTLVALDLEIARRTGRRTKLRIVEPAVEHLRWLAHESRIDRASMRERKSELAHVTSIEASKDCIPRTNGRKTAND